MAGAVGRPRKNNSRRRGNTAREEILDASAELFTTQGFATTSTHQIADAVGIRQASLYYHFPSKTEIFLALLTSTVTPSTALAAKFEEIDVPAPLRLWALTAAECRLLLSTRWNVGRLYQLPVASSPEFSEYHQQRTQLQAVFRSIAAKIVGPDDPRAGLPNRSVLPGCRRSLLCLPTPPSRFWVRRCPRIAWSALWNFWPIWIPSGNLPGLIPGELGK